MRWDEVDCTADGRVLDVFRWDICARCSFATGNQLIELISVQRIFLISQPAWDLLDFSFFIFLNLCVVPDFITVWCANLEVLNLHQILSKLVGIFIDTNWSFLSGLEFLLTPHNFMIEIIKRLPPLHKSISWSVLDTVKIIQKKSGPATFNVDEIPPTLSLLFEYVFPGANVKIEFIRRRKVLRDLLWNVSSEWNVYKCLL